MIIVEQGKVVELCAEPGELVYDTSTEPSIFWPVSVGESLRKTFATIGKRFTFGGDTAKDQHACIISTPRKLPETNTERQIPYLSELSIRT